MGQKLYVWAKKIHRWLVILILAGTVAMVGSGMLLGNPQWIVALGINPFAVRFFHGQIGVPFAGVLTVMSATGAYLYFYPKWTQKSKKPQAKPTASSPSPVDGQTQ